MSPQEAMLLICDEYQRATTLYPGFHSMHEGFAVIHEELDELWGAVKASKSVTASEQAQKEAVQIAAMALRFLTDLT